MKMASHSEASLTLEAYLEQQRQRVEERLQALVPGAEEEPVTLHCAMRHSLFAGGKRIRPIFCLEAARLCREATARLSRHSSGNSEESSDIVDISCTLELVHTYSLIHDDLPALDNDDYRRGQPTCHKAFGEAIAILAGDALLTLAFQVLAELPRTPADVRVTLIAELARAAGTSGGMIGGQVADLEAAAGGISPQCLEAMHRAKTAALFRAAVSLGALAAEAEPAQQAAITRFGECAGLAFQIADDILDVESSLEDLGKTAGKDALQKKATYPALYGVERSRQIAEEFIQEALEALEPFAESSGTLRELARFLISRKA